MLFRWLSLGWKVWQSNFGTLSRPYKLTYAITTRCNSRCRHCLSWQQTPPNELSLDEITTFARSHPHWSWIDFTGGEPTLRQDFVEIVGVFIRYNPDLVFVHFPTNGLQTGRIVDVCRRILALHPPRLVVTVSIDGPPAIHDAIRGVEGGFERACNTLQELRRLKGISVHAGMTLWPENVNEIDNTVAAIRSIIPDFSIRHMHVNIPHVSEHFYHNQETGLRVTKSMVASINAFMKERGMPRTLFEWVECMYQKRIAPYIQTGKCPQDCAALLASCFLGSEGILYPCAIWDAPVGNIRDVGYRLDTLLKSDVAHGMRAALLRKECPNCWTPCEAYQTLAANLMNGWPRLQRPVKKHDVDQRRHSK